MIGSQSAKSDNNDNISKDEDIIRGITKLNHDQYIKLCVQTLCIDLDVGHRFDYDQSIIKQTIEDSVIQKANLFKANIYCRCIKLKINDCRDNVDPTVIDSTDRKCRFCMKKDTILNKINTELANSQAKHSGMKINPIAAEFWPTFYNVMIKIISTEVYYNSSEDNNDEILKSELITPKVIFFKKVLECYNDLIYQYGYERTISDDNQTNSFDSLIPYFLVKDCVTEYSEIIGEVALYQQNSRYYDMLITNFKRWARYDPDFNKTTMQNSVYVKLFRALMNMQTKRMHKFCKSSQKYIYSAIISDYIKLKSNKANVIINDGFILGCRMNSPSLIDVFKKYVSNEQIEQVLNLQLLKRVNGMGDKARFFSRMSAKKIAQNVRDGL